MTEIDTYCTQHHKEKCRWKWLVKMIQEYEYGICVSQRNWYITVTDNSSCSCFACSLDKVACSCRLKKCLFCSITQTVSEVISVIQLFIVNFVLKHKYLRNGLLLASLVPLVMSCYQCICSTKLIGANFQYKTLVTYCPHAEILRFLPA